MKQSDQTTEAISRRRFLKSASTTASLFSLACGFPAFSQTTNRPPKANPAVGGKGGDTYETHAKGIRVFGSVFLLCTAVALRAAPATICYSAQPNAYFNDHAAEIKRSHQ
ncbi:MAG: hypothetical protein HY298_05410 [Verrucomicrobia bacterium]|nr:hypothetical protein [Verrucomicrobiota bacterium]